MQEKGFWDDIKRAEEVTKESKGIKDKIDRYENLVSRLDDVEVLAELAEDDEETVNEDDYEDYLNKIINKSIYKSKNTPTSKDKIITLTTCSYEFDNARTVVFAKKI